MRKTVSKKSTDTWNGKKDRIKILYTECDGKVDDLLVICVVNF